MALIKGLFAKDKHEKAPDFVKCDISIKRADLLEFLQSRNEEWINCQLLRSKENKLYIAENEYKKEVPPPPAGPPPRIVKEGGDLPF